MMIVEGGRRPGPIGARPYADVSPGLEGRAVGADFVRPAADWRPNGVYPASPPPAPDSRPWPSSALRSPPQPARGSTTDDEPRMAAFWWGDRPRPQPAAAGGEKYDADEAVAPARPSACPGAAAHDATAREVNLAPIAQPGLDAMHRARILPPIAANSSPSATAASPAACAPPRSVQFAGEATARSETGGGGVLLFDVLKPPERTSSLDEPATGAKGVDDAAPVPTSDAAPPSDVPFWEIVLVWSLSKNEAQKAYKTKEAVTLDLARRARESASAKARRDDDDDDCCAELCGCMTTWSVRHANELRKARAAMLDPLADDMLRSPTWRQVRDALLGAGLAVRLLRSKDDDEFFMAVGASLHALQLEAERTRFELRLRREGSAPTDKPAPFFDYKRDQDAHYERFTDMSADGVGGTGHAQLERGASLPALSSMERQRLIEAIMAKALIDKCGVNMTQLRNLHNACHDLIYLVRARGGSRRAPPPLSHCAPRRACRCGAARQHDEVERVFVEDSLGSNRVGCRVPRASDLRAHRLASLEKPRRYFGEAVCFYFAFLRWYSRALVLPSAVGAVTFVIYWVDEQMYLLLVPAFCLLTMVWSAGFIEQWQAREATLRHIWDMDEWAEHEGERLGYRGRIEQGIYTTHGHWVPIDDNELLVMGVKLTGPRSLRSSKRARRARELVSFGVLLGMGCLCIMTTLGIFAFRAYISSLAIGPYLAGALNAVAISTLNTAFRNAALQLNEWENHRKSSSFTAALVYKMFIFQFINCYFSLFFIAFVKPYGVTVLYVPPQECSGALRAGETLSAAQRCYDELQTQLMMIFLTNLLIGNISERFTAQSARISEWMSEAYESHRFRRRARDQREAPVSAQLRASALRRRRTRSSRAQQAASRPVAVPDGVAPPRPPSPHHEIAREREHEAARTAGRAKRDPRMGWQYALARGGTSDNLRGAAGKKQRTHPHVPAASDHRQLQNDAKARTFAGGAGGADGDDEYEQLRARIDEQDDLPMLLSEEHGLGPTFYEYNEIALQFGCAAKDARATAPEGLAARAAGAFAQRVRVASRVHSRPPRVLAA